MTRLETPTVPQHASPNSSLHDLAAADLRVLIDQSLGELTTLLPLLADLTDTRQHGIGVLTVTAERVIGDQIRKERRARLSNLKAGLTIPGESPAPVNIAAVSIAGEINLALSQLARRIRRNMATVGVCPLQPPPAPGVNRDGTLAPPATSRVIGDVRALIRLVASKQLLQEATRTVQDLLDRAKTITDGPSRIQHPRPCPHCGRHTLWIYRHGQVVDTVRCEPPTNSEPCRCRDSYCPCHHDRAHQHEWRRVAPTNAPTAIKKRWRSTSASLDGLTRDQDLAAREATYRNDQPQENR